MAANCNPDLILAKTLAAPFTPRSQGNPLSCRRTAEGGMVVIAADGRKLWFDAAEVNRAQLELKVKAQQAEKAENAARKRVPVRLPPLPPEPPQPPHQNNGQWVNAVIHKDQMKKP